MDERFRSALLLARERLRKALESMADAGSPQDEDEEYRQRLVTLAAEGVDWVVAEARKVA